MHKDIKVMRIASRVRSVVHEYQRLHFSKPGSHVAGWRPPVNIYVCDGQLDVCLDMAGVALEDIKIRVERNILIVDGIRQSPDREIRENPAACRKILAMEIESGSFSRAIDLPIVAERDRMQVDYREGLLWIRIPFGDR